MAAAAPPPPPCGAPGPARARRAVRLLREAGVKLDLCDESIATAAVFFHRFYAEHSPADFCSETMTMACLFLSAKASEQQRKARDVINVFNAISATPGTPPMPICQEFWDRKDLLVEYESYLLRALAFNVEVVMPHRYLLNYARSLRAPRVLVQVAWGLANDHFEAAACTEEQPQAVACAALHLAARLLRRALPGGAPLEARHAPAPAAATPAPAVAAARATAPLPGVASRQAAAAHAGNGGKARGGGTAGGGGGRGRGRGRSGGAVPRPVSSEWGGHQAPQQPVKTPTPETRNWHETFGVDAVALERVAAQIASVYDAGEGRTAALLPPVAAPVARPSSGSQDADHVGAAKRRRLAGEQEAHECHDETT